MPEALRTQLDIVGAERHPLALAVSSSVAPARQCAIAASTRPQRRSMVGLGKRRRLHRLLSASRLLPTRLATSSSVASGRAAPSRTAISTSWPTSVNGSSPSNWTRCSTTASLNRAAKWTLDGSFGRVSALDELASRPLRTHVRRRIPWVFRRFRESPTETLVLLPVGVVIGFPGADELRRVVN